MTDFATIRLPALPTVVAPDGSDVRVLLGLPAGGMAHFVLAGSGQMWRRQGEREEVVALEPGVCLSIPLGTHFQFRASATQSVSAVAITMPPWPGADEAVRVAGPWRASAD